MEDSLLAGGKAVMCTKETEAVAVVTVGDTRLASVVTARIVVVVDASIRGVALSLLGTEPQVSIRSNS